MMNDSSHYIRIITNRFNNRCGGRYPSKPFTLHLRVPIYHFSTHSIDPERDVEAPFKGPFIQKGLVYYQPPPHNSRGKDSLTSKPLWCHSRKQFCFEGQHLFIMVSGARNARVRLKGRDLLLKATTLSAPPIPRLPFRKDSSIEPLDPMRLK